MLIHHDVTDIADIDSPLATGMMRVFASYYRCRLKQMYLYSDEEVRNVGLPTTLNNDYDYEFANVLVTAQIAISDMAELYDKGISFQFEEVKDMERVYTSIRDYLHIAAEALNERNVSSEVARHNQHVINFIKDIKKFEQLGNALYPSFASNNKSTVHTGFGSVRLRNTLRRGQIKQSAKLTEEERRMQQRFHLDFRKGLIPYVKDSTSIWFREG